MSIINFLHPNLRSNVECSTITTEGYEVENLISSHLPLSQKGFLAERFIIGPVDILIKFVCPINIKYVAIWSKVGNQKSLGFELSSLTSTKYKENEFRRFATTVMPDHQNGVLFRQEGCKTELNSPDVELFHRCTFFRGRNHENVKELKVRIFKFHYVAALQKIEVWGTPSHFCDSHFKKDVWSLWSEIQREPIRLPVFYGNDPQIEPASISIAVANYSDPLPDDFYDEITNEVMTLPMILPSGKVVDYQTLEKHQKEEAKWGRPPSDPFTGVLYTERNKPIIGTALKSKMDLFLLKHSNMDCVKILPRRLGAENKNSVDFVVSKLVDQSTKKRKSHSDVAEEFLRSTEKCRAEEHARTKDLPTGDNRSKKFKENFKSYLRVPSPVRKDNIICMECSGLNQLYKLPCSHVTCRVCVIKNENSCTNCQKSYSFADIQKIHLPGLYELL